MAKKQNQSSPVCLKVFPITDVAKHATEYDCYMIIHGKVRDASYMNKHP
jgi:cytochrome b involved in lipid metabolism